MEQMLERNEEESSKRTLEILKSIQENPIPLSQRLSTYCSALEQIAKNFDKTSDQIVKMAEANTLPFKISVEVQELALLIKRHKTA